MTAQHSPIPSERSPHRRFVGVLMQPMVMLSAEVLGNARSLPEPIPTCARNMGGLVEDMIYLLLGERVSCSLGWPGTHCIARDDPSPMSHG